MSFAPLNDSRLFSFLYEIDRDVAETERAKPCSSCGAALHAANYMRKPRGGPEGLPADFSLRFSNCCSREGCRHRAMPASVRFLGAKVYLGVVVTLVAAMRQGPTPTAVRRLESIFSASRRTLKRWQEWWREIFPATRFWKAARARFMPLIEEGQLPGSLVERFRAKTIERLANLMRFLAPLTFGQGF